MPKPRTDRFCIRVDVCLSNELDESINRYQAELRAKGEKLNKAEAAERYIENMYLKIKEFPHSGRQT